MIYRNDLFICMYFIVGDDYQIYNDEQGLNEYYSQQTLDPIMIQYIGSNKVFPNDPRCPGANLLECCCRQEFSLNKGPGFIGGVESSIASMEVFHLYQKFKDISKYISSENRSPMSKGLARYIIFLFTKYTKNMFDYQKLLQSVMIIFALLEIIYVLEDARMLHFVTQEYADAMNTLKNDMEIVG